MRTRAIPAALHATADWLDKLADGLADVFQPPTAFQTAEHWKKLSDERDKAVGDLDRAHYDLRMAVDLCGDLTREAEGVRADLNDALDKLTVAYKVIDDTRVENQQLAAELERGRKANASSSQGGALASLSRIDLEAYVIEYQAKLEALRVRMMRAPDRALLADFILWLADQPPSSPAGSSVFGDPKQMTKARLHLLAETFLQLVNKPVAP